MPPPPGSCNLVLLYYSQYFLVCFGKLEGQEKGIECVLICKTISSWRLCLSLSPSCTAYITDSDLGLTISACAHAETFFLPQTGNWADIIFVVVLKYYTSFFAVKL